jgi:type I restriction enzyme S subunit
MTTGRVDFSTARRITHADFLAWTRKTKYQKDDVILSRRTNPGVTAVDDTGTEFALGQNLVLLRADGTKVYPPFLRWLVRGPEWWVQIEKFMGTSKNCPDLAAGIESGGHSGSGV